MNITALYVFCLTVVLCLAIPWTEGSTQRTLLITGAANGMALLLTAVVQRSIARSQEKAHAKADADAARHEARLRRL